MTVKETAEQRRVFWLNLSHRWKAIYWSVGVLSVTMSALAAATTVSKDAAPYFSLIAAICLSFVGFANPNKRALVTLSAYIVLDTALLDYELNTIDDTGLRDAIRKAEKLANPTSG